MKSAQQAGSSWRMKTSLTEGMTLTPSAPVKNLSSSLMVAPLPMPLLDLFVRGIGYNVVHNQ